MKQCLLPIARTLKPLWNRANEAVLGISTTQAMQPNSGKTRCGEWWKGQRSAAARFSDNFQYATVDYFNLRRVIRAIRPRRADVFYDIGCGMGRVLCVIARQELKRCVGIELFEPLCRIARSNAATMRGRKTPIEIVCGDAATADYAGGTIYWMFNPFGKQTMALTLERIRESLRMEARPITIVYYNTCHESVFMQARWLHRIREMKAPGGQRITFWRNDPNSFRG